MVQFLFRSIFLSINMLNAEIMSIIATKEPWLACEHAMCVQDVEGIQLLNEAKSKELMAEVKKEYANGNPFTYFDPNFMCDTTHCTKGKGHSGLCSVDIRVGKRKRPSRCGSGA